MKVIKIKKKNVYDLINDEYNRRYEIKKKLGYYCHCITNKFDIELYNDICRKYGVNW